METTPLITHSYQARTSLLISSEYANGGKVEYIYDTLDRVLGVKIDNATSPQFEYRYDASDNLAIVKDNLRNITTTLEYDLANRLSKITDSQGHSITYGFDAKNRLSGVSEVLKGSWLHVKSCLLFVSHAYQNVSLRRFGISVLQN